MNVFSVSCDGKVNNWVLMQSELVVTTVITLTLPIEQVSGPDGALVSITGEIRTFSEYLAGLFLVPPRPLINYV